MSNGANDPRDAISALDAALRVYEEAHHKLGRLLGRQRALGRSTTATVRLRNRVSQRLAFLSQRLAEVRAASTVIAAPPVAEISAVRSLVATVQGIALDDAVTQTILGRLRSALEQADQLAGGVRT